MRKEIVETEIFIICRSGDRKIMESIGMKSEGLKQEKECETNSDSSDEHLQK